MNASLTTSPSNSGGFTLVEMLMALLIMTVGLLGLLQSVNVAYQQSLRNRVRDEAVLVAEGQMNDWRRVPFQEISSDSFSVEKTVAGVPTRFAVRREVQEMGNSAKNTKRLKVAVQWSVRGETTSHEIYTMRNR